MANEAFKQLYVQGLQAVEAAPDQGSAASGSEHARDAPPEIHDLMVGGASVFGQHAETLNGLLRRPASSRRRRSPRTASSRPTALWLRPPSTSGSTRTRGR